MNVLQTIHNVEKEADEIINKAKEEASSITLYAHKEKEEEIVTLKKTLKENELQAVSSQKKILVKLYKKINDDGKKGIDKIKEKQRRNKGETIQFILNNIQP